MDNIALVLQSFSQNLRFLSNLQALSPFNFNTQSGSTDNAFTVGIAVPSNTGRKIVGTQSSPFFISIVPNPISNVLLGSDFRTLPNGGVIDQASPFTIFTYIYNTVSSTSNLLFNVGAQVSGTFTTPSKVDIQLYVNTMLQFSSRVYVGQSDIGSTSFSVSVPSTGILGNRIQLLATATADNLNNLNVPQAFISIMES